MSRWLVFGATGLFGQAALKTLHDRGASVTGAARKGADHRVDLLTPGAAARLIETVRPHFVVNAAALVDLAACEAEPERAARIHAGAVAEMAAACAEIGSRLIQISTDQYWSGDRDSLHDETAPVHPPNVYSRTKLAGEDAAGPDALVVRTNIAGVRGWTGRPSFAEWACAAIEAEAPLSLFDDYFTSTAQAGQVAQAVIDLAEDGAAGVFNIAAREPASKHDFVLALAHALDREPGPVTVSSVKRLTPNRADSCGLDVSRAERRLGRRLPDLKAVCGAIAQEWRAHPNKESE